jgi:8-oxo-dGTP pyrophosphatase MutT (NUDIX family)
MSAAAGGVPPDPSPRAALAAELRGVLLEPAAAARLRVPGRRHAGVLVPLYLDGAGALHGVFTRRKEDLRRHPGEVSFPGGRRDEEDADLCATALRETHEEIGLPPDAVELLGALQPTPTFVTDYAIYPFVGLIEPGFAWAVAHAEVARVLELPLEAIRAGYARRRLVRRGLPFRTDTYVVGDEMIWGATARIVADLLDRIPPRPATA